MGMQQADFPAVFFEFCHGTQMKIQVQMSWVGQSTRMQRKIAEMGFARCNPSDAEGQLVQLIGLFIAPEKSHKQSLDIIAASKIFAFLSSLKLDWGFCKASSTILWLG